MNLNCHPHTQQLYIRLGVNIADVSQLVPSCKASGLFDEAAYAAKLTSFSDIIRRDRRADQDTLLQEIQHGLPPLAHRVLHLVEILHDYLRLVVDHSCGFDHGGSIIAVVLLYELGERFALE